MAGPEPPAGFVEFVRARSDVLLRSAWLLTGDTGRAEDLLQMALTRAWRNWRTVQQAQSPEAYVRRVIFTTYVSSWRRRWRAEMPSDNVPDASGSHDVASDVASRDAVRRALARLSRRARAIVILRYVEDRPVTEVAELLGCSAGSVKTLASRALETLRQDPHLKLATTEGVRT